MRIAFRRPGSPQGDRQDWTEMVYWPMTLRVPVAGELVDLEHGQFVVESVQWFTEALSGDVARQHRSVQVILR